MDETAMPRWEQAEKRFQVPMLVAALLVIPAIALGTSDPGEPWETLAVILNWGIWLAFLTEVVVMLSLVPSKRRWLRDNPFDVAIVVLTPPFLPASLQAARALRLLQIVRLLKLASALRGLLTTEGLRDAALLAVMTVLIGGTAYAAVEKTDPNGASLSAWDGVWWAVTIVTTVGYGDNYPRTDTGRMIAIVVMAVGIGFVALLTAAAADRFMRSRAEEEARIEERLDEVLERLKALEEEPRSRADRPR